MEIKIGKKLNRETLINAHLFIVEEMTKRGIKHKIHDGMDRATQKLKRGLKKSDDNAEILRKGVEEKSLAELEVGMSGQFIVQAHTRGESVHCDIRMLIVKPEKADHLIGITANTPGNKEKRNKLLKPRKDEKILCEIKSAQPLSWLKVGEDGPVEVDPGEVGAGENVSGEFAKIDGGTWKAGTQDPHYKEFQFMGEKIKGRWMLTYVPVPDGWNKAGENERVWLLSRPENQEMDADKEKDKAEKQQVKILKSKKKQHIVTGVVLEPEITDLQGDIISVYEIEQAAYKFMENYGRIGYMHKEFNREFRILESWLSPVDMIINSVKVKLGSWLMSVRVLEPEIWKQIENGEITGFSIGGESRSEKV